MNVALFTDLELVVLWHAVKHGPPDPLTMAAIEDELRRRSRRLYEKSLSTESAVAQAAETVSTRPSDRPDDA